MFVKYLQQIWADVDHPFLQSPIGLDLKFNESTGRLYQVEVNYGMNRSRYDD